MRSLVFWSRLTLIGAIKSSGHQAGFSPVVPRFCRITSRTPASPQTKRIQISPLRCHGSGDVMLSDVSPNIGESHWCHVCLLLMGRTRSRTDRSRTAGLQRRSPPTRFLCCGCRCGQRWPRPPRTPAETHTHTHTHGHHRRHMSECQHLCWDALYPAGPAVPLIPDLTQALAVRPLGPRVETVRKLHVGGVFHPTDGEY